MLIGEISSEIKYDKNQRLVTFPLLRNYKPHAKHIVYTLSWFTWRHLLVDYTDQ